MSDTMALRAIQQLGQTYRALMAGFETSIGYSVPRWRILLSLYHQGEMSQKLLAQQLRLDPGALTRHIKAIECDGLVARNNDSTDNRLTNVVLTDEGRKSVQHTLPRRAAFFESAFGDLSEAQAEELIIVLRKLEVRMQSESSEPVVDQGQIEVAQSGASQQG
ncbi:winged helix-turn-helix transcriptional regulator [Alcaligenaceae bacterium]|nr:winged helix-turn-helix transcriptional regulator [Alcaligenaceae bacterium]